MLPRLLIPVLAAVVTLLATSVVAAKPKGLRALAAPEEVVFDGVPNEFDSDWRELEYAVKGRAKKGDISARATIAYDKAAIYVAADVADDKLVGGSDHVELLLGIPGGELVSVRLYPGVAGKSKAEAKDGDGRKIDGAKIVEAPAGKGFSLEAKIPWSAIPRSSTIRIGYRGALFVHDTDGSSEDTVIATAETREYDELPPVSMMAELVLGSGLLRSRNIKTPPTRNLLANVVGDKLMERVLVYDRFLVVLGPGYRNGEQYYYRDLGTAELSEMTVKDMTGDGKADILIRKSLPLDGGTVDLVEVLSYLGDEETPAAVFAHEVGVGLASGGKIQNEVSISGSGSSTKIVLTPGDSSGVETGLSLASSTGAAPVLAPWGSVASRTFTVENGAFVMSHEAVREGSPQEVAHAVPPAPESKPVPKRPKPKTSRVTPKPSAPPDLDEVYALYKKQRKVSGKARWDHSQNLVGGSERERVVVHGRDLVVFGSSFRGGRGFSAITLSQFENDEDITSVTTRDVTRDGRHEIVIRGEIRTPLPDDIGEGDIHREVILIYQVKGELIERVFAAEVGRRIGDKRIVGKIAFPKKGKHLIELKPGSADGYTEDTYPFKQRTSPDGDFEPLLLPWGGIEHVRLRFDGDQFVRLED